MDCNDLAYTTAMRWLPEPRVAPLAPAIEQRISLYAASLRAANFSEFLDPLMKRLLANCYRDAGAHEGVIWLLDEERKHILCAWQIGEHAIKLTSHRQPLDATISGMVLAMQQPFCENHLSSNREVASKLDEKLGVIICSRILVPFFIAGKLKGIVSCYQTKADESKPDPPGFDTDAVEEISMLTRLLSRLLDYKLLCAATGVEEE